MMKKKQLVLVWGGEGFLLPLRLGRFTQDVEDFAHGSASTSFRRIGASTRLGKKCGSASSRLQQVKLVPTGCNAKSPILGSGSLHENGCR